MIKYISDPAQFAEKERLYLSIRNQEGRVLSDEVARQLPFTTPQNPAYSEWKIRRRSFERLNAYLQQRYGHQKINILDLGCGNGWLSNRLAQTETFQITAVDLNIPELEQGDRLFARKNLQFIYADILENTLQQNQFDLVLIAGSVQYFPDFDDLMNALWMTMAAQGEIHIIDSPFYKDSAAREQAAMRTTAYYRMKGVEGMADYYHHHQLSDLTPYHYVDMNQGIWNKVLKKLGFLPPFPWIRIQKT